MALKAGKGVSQTCVRVNPHHLVGEGSQVEERDVITSVVRPISHAVFSSKQIRIFGPLSARSGGIPLREYLVGAGDRTGLVTKQFEGLPNPVATTFYAHYTGDELTAKHFEAIWQFYRFAKGERITDIDAQMRETILTLRHTVEAPRSAYDLCTHRYIYEGWEEAHFKAFFDEYCALKAAATVLEASDTADASEWMALQPPRPLTLAELQIYSDDTRSCTLSDDVEPTKLDMTLDELVAMAKAAKKASKTKIPVIAKKTAKKKKGPPGHLKAMEPNNFRKAERPKVSSIYSPDQPIIRCTTNTDKRQVSKDTPCPTNIHKYCRKYRFKKNQQPIETNPANRRGKSLAERVSFPKGRQQLFRKHLAKRQNARGFSHPSKQQAVDLRPQTIPDYLSLPNDMEPLPEIDLDLLGDFSSDDEHMILA